MTSFNCHDPSSINWNEKTYQPKETSITSYRPSNINHWSLSYDSTNTAAAGSSYKPLVTSNSPLISTPFLDSSVDDILSPACFSPYAALSPHLNQNYQHQPIHHSQQATDISVGQYIDKKQSTKVKQEPIFTGDPMELLIDKSKAVSASPMCSTSEDMTAPLFMPILLHDHHQQNQHTHHQGTTGHQFMMGQDTMDWPCYNDGNDLLFHALDGLMDTATSLSLVPDNSRREDEHQFHHQYQSSSSPSTSHQQQTTDQYPSPSPSTDEDHTSRSTHESTEHTKSLTDNSNNNKRKRSNSKESTGSDSDNSQKRAKKTGTKQNEKRYGCPICRRKFSRRFNLNSHIKTHCKNRIKEFACDICGTGFDRKHDRDRHISSVHHGTRSYPCTHCDSAFCRRDALARHVLKSHGGDSS